MKTKIHALIFVLLFAAIFLISFSFLKSNEQIFSDAIPGEDISVQSDDESESIIKRSLWIEQIHRADADTDWRKIEFENRKKKYERFIGLSASGLKSQTRSSVVAGGLSGTWAEKGSNNIAGRIVAADYDASTDLIYCASGGGTIWKKSFNGYMWAPVNDKINFGNILMTRVINNGSTHRIVAATSQAPYFYYSDNYGTTWNTASGLSNFILWGELIDAVVIDDNRHTIYLLGFEWNYRKNYAQTTLYRSTNMGLSFSAIISYPETQYGNSEAFDLWAPRYVNAPCYMANQRGDQAYFYKLDLNTGKPAQVSKFKVSVPGSPMITGFYAARMTFYMYCGGKLYSSTDNGSRWSYKSSPPEGPFDKNSLCASINNQNIVFLGGVRAIKSKDGGLTWSNISNINDYLENPQNNLHPDAPCIVSVRRQREYELIGTDGGLYISADTMRTVTNLSMLFLNNSQYYSTLTSSDTTRLFAGSQDQGFQFCRINGSGVHPFRQVVGGDYGNIVSADGGNNIWTVYPAFTAFFQNAVNPAGFTATWDFNGSSYYWMPPLMSDPAGNPYVAYFAGTSLSGSGSHIIKLSYASGNISATETPYDFYAASSGGYLSAISFSPINRDFWYAMTDNGNFFYSTNAGTSWSRASSFSGPEPHYLCGSTIYASHNQLGLIYVGGSGYSNPAVYKSTDNGLTFTRMDNGLPSTLVHQITADNSENYLFAATDAGPYVYSVDQNQWFDMAGSEAPDQIYWSVEYIPSGNVVRFGTYGRGIWDFRISQPAPVIAKSFEQHAITEVMPLIEDFTIYPNPSTGVFNLKVAHFTSALLKVYDFSGKVVYFKKITEPSFDLTGMPSGVYFAEFNFNQKIIIIKIIVR